MKFLALWLVLFATHAKAQSLTNSKFINIDASGYLTLSGQTNRLTDSGTALQYNGVSVGAGISGTVINAGTPVTTAIPIYSGTTGTNIVPSSVTIAGTTNVNAGGLTLDGNGALSDPTLSLTGTWITGGTATTTKPMVLVEPTGATSTAWSTAGTGLGINAASGFTGNVIDLQLDGVSKFTANYDGAVTAEGTNPYFECNYLGSSARSALQTGGLVMNNVGSVIWSSTTSHTTVRDLYLSRDAAATLQHGVDAASPVAQIIKAHDGLGADKLGADLTVRPGNGTGTGTGGSLIFQTTPAGSTGSSQNTPVTRLSFDSNGSANNVVNSIASAPAEKFTGTWFTGGSATTTKPHVLIEPTGTTSTGWSTSGTGLGVNGQGTSDLANFMLDGSSRFKISSTGIETLSNGTSSGLIKPFAAASGNGIASVLSNGTTAGDFHASMYWVGSSSSTLSAVLSSTSGLLLNNAMRVAFSSDAFYGSADTLISRDAAATLQLGLDAASPVTQTLKSHDGSGTDKDGAKLNLNGGNSTGTGRGGSVFIGTSLTGSTGSSANSITIRKAAIAKPVTLTEASATTILNLAFGSSKYLGATIVVTVNAEDATDFQALTSTLNISAVNKAGTVTTTITQVDGTVAASAGTLTPVTFTAVVNGASVDIKCAATSSLTQTTLAAKLVITALNSDGVVTITEQ